MPVIANLHPLAAHRHHAFDVELVLAQSLDAFSFKDDDFAALGSEKVVSHSVNEQVVARAHAELQNILTFTERLSYLEARALPQSLLPVVGGKPNGVRLASDHQCLPNIKNENTEWL